MKKLGFVVAMSSELKDFLNGFGKIEQTTFGEFIVYFVNANDKQLYIIQSGVGEIHSAMATQYLITKYQVEVVINFGVCGKLNNNLKLLDSVVIDRLIHYQFDTSFLDHCEVGKYSQYDSVFIKTDRNLINRVVEYFPNIKMVTCASGDKFIGEIKDKQMLVNDFKSDICEMESAGILLTCNANDIPCLMIKSVSDDCSELDFNTYLSLAVKKHIEIINKLIEIL